MDRISFVIFIPDEKKFHLTPNWIVYGLWFTTIGFFWLFDNYFTGDDEFRTIIVFCVAIVTFYYLITSFVKYKSLNGTLNGDVIFEEDRIKVNDKIFELKDINNLDFCVNDYYGKKALTSRGDFDPQLSQGVNNYVTYTDSSGETQTIYFKLATEHHYDCLSPFINAAIKAKKLAFKRGIDIVGIENVSINS